MYGHAGRMTGCLGYVAASETTQQLQFNNKAMYETWMPTMIDAESTRQQKTVDPIFRPTIFDIHGTRHGSIPASILSLVVSESA